MQRTAGGLIAVSLAIVGLGTPSTASAAGPICPVTDGPTLTTALADAGCTTINLAAGSYTSATSPAFSVNHDVTMVGAGSSQTTLTRTGAGDILRVITAGSDLDLRDISISGAADGSGIGINVATSAQISHATIADNEKTSSSGAGISFSGTALDVTDSVIANNTVANAFDTGGGGGSNNNTGTATFNRVLFTGNEANTEGGGGAWDSNVVGGVTNFTNVTFSGNSTEGDGGALRNGSGATAHLTDVTMTGNVADSDNGGLAGDGGGILTHGSALTVANSIIAGNIDVTGGAGAIPDCGGSTAVTRLGYDLIGDPTNCTFGGTGDTATGYQSGVDPQLSQLANSGGFSASLAPIPGSPAIDQIPAASCGAATDQRGVARPQNGACDLGAVEREFFAPFPFRNPDLITINDAPMAAPFRAAASPYPSPIAVNGVPGTITDLTVRLDGLVHTFSDDVDVLLVGPRGQAAMLMSDAGGGFDTSGGTMDFNTAGLPLPDDDPLLSRTYAPAAFDTSLTISLLAPAPAAPYTASLTPFIGTDPNGTWTLYVDDHAANDEGEIVNGWALDIKTTPALTPAVPHRKKCKKKKKKKHAAAAKKKKCKKKKKK